MSAPRVALVIPTLAPGGTERQLLYLAEGLRPVFEVDVICTARPGPWAERLAASCRVTALHCRSGWDPRLQSRAFAAFDDARPDIVHSFLFGFDYAVNVAARRAGVPVVVSSRRQLATWKRPRHVRLQRNANDLVDAIVANAEAVADFARAQEGSRPELYRVIHNGIDAAAFQVDEGPEVVRRELGLPQEGPVVGMVANFSPVKDHGLFVEVARTLVPRVAGVHFLLVGEGRLRKKTERALRSAAIGDRLTIVGGVDHPARYYRAMDVAMLCSQVEGFPNATLEAMAAGVPFVGPAVGGIPELVTHNQTGCLVTGRDPKDFAAVIAGLLDDAEAHRHIAENAAFHVMTHFSAGTMAGRYTGLYRKLLGLRASRKEAG